MTRPGATAPTAGDAIYPSLRGRAVLVTGGAAGIGASIVEHFAAQGARVGVLDQDEAAAARVAAAVAASGHQPPLFERCDLRDLGALAGAIAALRARLGPIGVLVNNAARDDRHALGEVTPAYWDERIAVNLRHQFFAAQAVVPDMRGLGGGAIVNLGSVSWRLGMGGMPVYLTAKAGVEGLTRALARDLGTDRIRVNTVVPGWVMTERQVALWLTPDSERRMLEAQCLKDKLAPADIARLVLWLAADDSRMVTAQSFVCDAGWS